MHSRNCPSQNSVVPCHSSLARKCKASCGCP
ncbi:MAG TPA: hypothetical protein DEH24_12930 [Alteromonas sp.]|nr:hypothetical protein [Alteromonas sp.]